MHQIGVVGLSYRHAGVDAVARFSVPKADIPTRLPALRDALRVSELFYIATCNRVEVLYANAEGAPAGDARREVFRALTGRAPSDGEATRLLRAWTGEAAVEHLFLVACGLDSARAGEQEIAAQIRGAWDTARSARTCGATLDRVIGEALSMAGRVRRMEADVRAPSLADLASDRIITHLAASRAPVALVGVSPMTRRCGMLLHQAGIPLLIVNRTLSAAEEMAVAVQGRALPLEEFRAAPPEVGALVLAAGGGQPILDGDALMKIGAMQIGAMHAGAMHAGARSDGVMSDRVMSDGVMSDGVMSTRATSAGVINAGEMHADAGSMNTGAAADRKRPLLIDFGVPPNAEPQAALAAGISRVGMDDLIEAAQAHRLAQLMRLAPVRAAIDERLEHLRNELATRAIGRRLSDLRETFQQIAAEELERTLATELRDLDDNQRRSLERFASTVARRLAHLPLAGLRAAAAHASTDAVDAFFREARLTRMNPDSDSSDRQSK